MPKITILNNNTIMKNGVVFTVPGQPEGPAKVLPNGKTVFQPDTDKDRELKKSIALGTFEGPDSIEDVIDNMKETNLNLWGE